MTQHTQVAIIGASFAGLSAYRKVKKCCGADVKLFDMRSKFTRIPGLHEALGNPGRLRTLQFDLHKVYGKDFIQQKVTHVQQRMLQTEDGTTWTFDYAVIATGSRTNFFGNEHFEKYCYTLRYPEDVGKLNQVLPTAQHISVI
ncbi:MAG: FAD-dependent oxidoreductase [Candidatus Peribacteria bacterium]|nr:MAG: FAD-dependent oxidoreductase [Candidatus Peribacteria bacterium]